MQLSGTLGERIAVLREENRMSQKDLADFLYVNQGTISRWEKGVRYPEKELILKMAQRFGVDPKLLLKAPLDSIPVIILVDDDELSLEINVPTLQNMMPDTEVFGFATAEQALLLAKERRVHVAFLDIDLYRESGLTLAESLVALYPDINIIFLTGHSEYMKNAFSLHASGYILKPAMDEDFVNELTHLRYPVRGLVLSNDH